MARVLEGGLVVAEHRLLADDAAPAHRLQRARQAEDAPVPLAQLHRQVAQVLQPDAVPPLSTTNETQTITTTSTSFPKTTS